MSSNESKIPLSLGWFDQNRRDALSIFFIAIAFSLILILQLLGPLKSLTGDEPHYLVVAHSLVSDGDLNLWDDYNVDKAWENFYTGELLPHYAQGIQGNYSTRIVGLGIYQVPFYLLGQMTGEILFWTRLGMSLLYAALMAALYLLCRDLGIERKAAFLANITALAIVPLAFYSYSIYSEVPTALLSVLAVRLMLKWDEMSLINPLLAGLCLALMPWLGLKYAVISAVLGLGFLIYIFRTKAPLLRSMSYFALFPLVLLLLLAIYLYFFYGSFSPSVIYTGVGENAKTYAGLNMQSYGAGDGIVGGTLRMFLAYFIDQREGLLFYSPVYLFGIAGLLLMQGKVKFSRTITILFIAFLGTYAYTQWGSGHAPSCRPMVSVLWVLVIGLGYSYERISSFFSKLILASALAVSASFAFLGIIRNFLMYHVVMGHTETHGNNFLESITIPLRTATLFPNLINPRDIHPVPTVIILTVFVAIILLLTRFLSSEKKPAKPENFALQAGPYMIAACLPVLLFVVGFLNAELISPEEMQGRGAVRLVFKDDNTYGYEPGNRQGINLPGFWQRSGTRADVDVICAEKPKKLEIELLSHKPQRIILKVEGATFGVDFKRSSWKTIEIPGGLAARWLNRSIFRMQITSPSGVRPSDHGSDDSRELGCRVVVNARN